MNTGSRKRDLDEFEPAIHAQGASHGVAKRLRPGRCGKEGLMPTVVATNMKKHSFEEDKLNVPDRSEQEELDAINRRVESPVTSIDVDMMDVSIQEHIAVEQGGKEKFTHHVHFKYMDDSRLQKMLRSQALQQTHQQIRELFKIIHAPTSDQNPSKWLHDLLHSLLGFALAAERNPFCWHLTAAEQDEFRDIASDMVLIAATMPLEQRQRFPLKPLIDLNVLFKSMLGMEGLLDSFYILFDDSENCNNAFGLPNYPISES